jgi:hypothetical protein
MGAGSAVSEGRHVRHVFELTKAALLYYESAQNPRLHALAHEAFTHPLHVAPFPSRHVNVLVLEKGVSDGSVVVTNCLQLIQPSDLWELEVAIGALAMLGTGEMRNRRAAQIW